MKVLYDYQIFRSQRYGGISRYFTNLIMFFEENEAIVPCYHPKNYYYNKLKGTYDYKYESMIFETLNDTASRWMTKNVLRRDNVDIFHPTSTDTYFLKHIRNEKLVVTVHDLVKELYPDFARHREDFIERRKKLLMAADHIIAVSNNTKEDVVSFYGVDPGKVTVVYHGLPNKFGKIRINLRGLPERYILYVGQRTQNKNFKPFLEAVSELMQDDRSLSLLCVGGGEFTEEERDMIYDMDLQKQVRQRNLNDEVLAACYKQALCFVFPSIYEGFGIPILEAFKMGCPIVLSDIASFREVAGEAGHFMDPNDVRSMREVIGYVLDGKNTKEVQDKVARGKVHVEDFTLSHTYFNTMEVYQEVLEKDL